ncbi:hypothetical protein G7B40_014985 [Aetokthonos hydrillicola Thurmond2011]|jgi:hypothetical protein|uniref:Uncharacterized protein n=1 Tax=Aetokthonos hydrillicola Thurmond2011 TaxID=2712845 RepID=A0AAP5I9U8_9CYAN|nr:hypothetical protein [Aetokthonos hydrillicola Thurmond2011]
MQKQLLILKVCTWRELLRGFRGQALYNKYFHGWQRNGMWAEIKSSLLGQFNVQIGKIYPQSSNYRAPLGDENNGASIALMRRELFNLRCLNLQPAAFYFLVSASPKSNRDARLVTRKFSLVATVHLLVASAAARKSKVKSQKFYISRLMTV